MVPGLTSEQRAEIRRAARTMTSMDLLRRYGAALAAWARAASPEEAQVQHDMAMEWAEAHGNIRRSR